MGDDAELRNFYEAEATARQRPPISPARRELCDRFIRLLRTEGRSSVVDLGAGPGLEGPAFIEAGIRYTGVDLAVGNGHLAAESNITVVPGSIVMPPFRAHSFDAAWSGSVLMHLDAAAMADAVAAMADLVQPHSPALIGLWCSDTDHLSVETDDRSNTRSFHLRTPATNLAIIGRRFDVTSTDTWPDVGRDDEYFVIIEARARPTLA